MVVIRLARGGRKRRPFYMIVVAEAHNSRDGKFIKKIGFYDPIAPKGVEAVRIDMEQLAYWESAGAQLSPTVKRLSRSTNKIN